MPSLLSWGIGRAATQLKTLLQYYGKSFEALPGVAYPGVQDNRSTLNTKTGYEWKKNPHLEMDRHQNLTTFTKSPLAHAYHVWSTSVTAIVS